MLGKEELFLGEWGVDHDEFPSRKGYIRITPYFTALLKKKGKDVEVTFVVALSVYVFYLLYFVISVFVGGGCSPRLFLIFFLFQWRNDPELFS